MSMGVPAGPNSNEPNRMQRHFPQCPFARYADDAVVHCRSEAQAQEVIHAIASRLAECGLEMHPEKSGIVYCRDRSRTQAYPNVTFTFLGFLFRPRRVMTRSGQLSTSFLPGVSRDALKRMRQTVRGWRLPRQTFRSLVELADQCNPTIGDWWNYYGLSIGRPCRGSVGIWTASSHAGAGASTKRYDGINGVATSGCTR
ncbi:hypothetical protein R75465_05452 [Paraburkholderia aspalathi]|nr:hypothetical protein R75465_05452 [Paraburkholderia aspalathi]